MTVTGTFHLVFSLAALGLGATVFLLPKGTRWHRKWGHGYAWAMVGVVGTSFAMYNLTGRVTPFHVAALISGASIVGGMWTVLGRTPKQHWIAAHARWMAWSYVGLVAAFVAETSTRLVMPALESTLERSAMWPAFWIVVALVSFGVFGAGAWLIRTRLGEAVRKVPESARR
jgi:uncharacterized membrane protein